MKHRKRFFYVRNLLSSLRATGHTLMSPSAAMQTMQDTHMICLCGAPAHNQSVFVGFVGSVVLTFGVGAAPLLWSSVAGRARVSVCCGAAVCFYTHTHTEMR